MDEEFGAEAVARQRKFERRILEAQWHGGSIQFGRPGQPGSYIKTFQPMKQMPAEIHIRWVSEYLDNFGNPVQGRDATAEVSFGDYKDEYVIEAEYQYYDKMVRRKVKDYAPMAEAWCMWKWHTQRGTPVDEHDKYLLEPGFKAPLIVWDKALFAQPEPEPAQEAPKRKRGRPPKQEPIAA